MSKTVITADEFESYVVTLSSEQEVADVMNLELPELKNFVQAQYGNKPFDKIQNMLKLKVKASLNNEALKGASKNSSMNKAARDNILKVDETPKTEPKKPLKLEYVKFVNARFSGKNMKESYKEVFPDASDATCSKNANVIMKRPEVIEYYEQCERDEIAMYKANKSKLIKGLVDIVEDPDGYSADKIRAITQMSKMLGHDAPIKTENKNITLGDVINELQK